jgi:ribonucleoside-diphosphate reductase beta chain
VADIILEGLFFYSGFAFFYNLARDQKMLATSKMISYIQRDENQHVHYFATMFKQLLADYPELDTKENKAYVYKTFDRAVQLETDWAYHLLDGIKGLDLEDLSDYIKFKANQRLSQMGLEKPYEGVDNCLPWIRPFSDEALNATNTDFFEGKPRTYAKVTSDFDDL